MCLKPTGHTSDGLKQVNTSQNSYFGFIQIDSLHKNENPVIKSSPTSNFFWGGGGNYLFKFIVMYYCKNKKIKSTGGEHFISAVKRLIAYKVKFIYILYMCVMCVFI